MTKILANGLRCSVMAVLLLMMIAPASRAYVESSIVPDPEVNLICNPVHPQAGHFYYPGDYNNSLDQDAENYLNDRYDLRLIHSVAEYVDISDAISILNHLFMNGPAPAIPDAGDFNRDDHVDISDAISMLNYLFSGGEYPGDGKLRVTHVEYSGRGIDTLNYMTTGEDVRMTIEQGGTLVSDSGITFRKFVVAVQTLDDPDNFDYSPLITILGPYSNPWSYMYHPEEINCPDGSYAKALEFYLPDYPNAVAYIEMNGHYTTTPFFVTFNGFDVLESDFPVYSSPLMGMAASDDSCHNPPIVNGGAVVHVERLVCPEYLQPPPLTDAQLEAMFKRDLPMPPMGPLGEPLFPAGARSAPPGCDINLPDWMEDAIDKGTAVNDFLNDELGITFGGGLDGPSMGLNGTGIAHVAQGCTVAYSYCETACSWMGDRLTDAGKAAADAVKNAYDKVVDGLQSLGDSISSLWN